MGAVSEQRKEADVVSVLQATIDTLQEQLEVKDQQIEKLTEALRAAQTVSYTHLPRTPQGGFSGSPRVNIRPPLYCARKAA